MARVEFNPRDLFGQQVTEGLEGSAGQFFIEVTEFQCVGTVERGKPQAREGHEK